MKTPLSARIFLPATLLAAVLFLACAGNGGPVRTGRIDALFARWDSPESPGCALAVIEDGRIAYTRGYGMADLEHDVPITPETVFYIGSESKQFVTACLLLLEEEGRLSLDDDIRKFVPELPSYGAPITIRHCILHTSGLRDYFTLWSLAGVDYANFHPEMEVVDLIARQKELNFPPGEDRLYSNSGYLLLSVVIRRASGMSLAEFARERIFEPLGMEDSHFHDDPSRIVKNRAHGYFRTERDKWGLLAFRFALVGSGGLYTNVPDLAKWDANFYHNTLGEGGRELIRKMTTPGTLNNGDKLSYACALAIGEYRGLSTVRHGGSLGGYRSHILRFPEERTTVILLFNLADVDPGAFAERVADIWLEDRLDPLPPREGDNGSGKEDDGDDAGPSFTLSRNELAEYASSYRSGELLVTYEIEPGANVLRCRINGLPPVTLVPAAPDLFIEGDGEGEFTFLRDGRGGITGFTVAAGRVRNIGFERID